MAKVIKFTVDLNVDGQRHLVEASTNAEDLAQNLAKAKGKAEILRGSLVSFGQLQSFIPPMI